MGAECSDEQLALLIAKITRDGRAWVMPDGDKAGEKFAQSIVPRIAAERFVRWIKLWKDGQPTDLKGSELKECFSK